MLTLEGVIVPLAPPFGYATGWIRLHALKLVGCWSGGSTLLSEWFRRRVIGRSSRLYVVGCRWSGWTRTRFGTNSNGTGPRCWPSTAGHLCATMWAMWGAPWTWTWPIGSTGGDCRRARRHWPSWRRAGTPKMRCGGAAIGRSWCTTTRQPTWIESPTTIPWCWSLHRWSKTNASLRFLSVNQKLNKLKQIALPKRVHHKSLIIIREQEWVHRSRIFRWRVPLITRCIIWC